MFDLQNVGAGACAVNYQSELVMIGGQGEVAMKLPAFGGDIIVGGEGDGNYHGKVDR